MVTAEIKIPTPGRPIEALTMCGEDKPKKAFLILPGKGYTINHFLLDFLWRMAAEAGFYAIKAEYRGYTYRHLDEPYDHDHAIEDLGYVLDYLAEVGYKSQNIIICGKSLGTVALAGAVAKRQESFAQAVLLTPVLYYKREAGVFPMWDVYKQKVGSSYLIFGSDDPFCDLVTAKAAFPESQMDCYQGADHGLNLDGNYTRTIEINREIIEKVKSFITKI
ncbi:MAG: hypothetical protein CVV03_12100 [Firmicutes bacterium HGW-Firmicutes-8]|nr:MAG: hypothetical protein CVV03_12100 [Firmicutes bacterium HGW-Firmicutes-8]